MSITCRKVGNSIVTTIPTEIVNKLGLKPGDELDVREESGIIMFSPVQKKLKGELFLEEFYGKPAEEIRNLETETVDWGEPQGEEIW